MTLPQPYVVNTRSDRTPMLNDELFLYVKLVFCCGDGEPAVSAMVAQPLTGRPYPLHVQRKLRLRHDPSVSLDWA